MTYLKELMDSLEIYVLRSATPGEAVVLGRRGNDVAIEQVSSIGAKSLRALTAFRERIEDAVVGRNERPNRDELQQYGTDLFNWLFQGTLRSLYDQLPNGSVSLQLVSNWAEIKGVPWEYLQPPYMRVPHRNRSVVRVLPTLGVRYTPGNAKVKKLRVLFVFADPVDQAGVDFDTVQAVTASAYGAQVPDAVEVKVIEGATRKALSKAIAGEHFDIFHFFGHGTIKDQEGQLVLVDIGTQKSDLISASELATLLAGKGVKLAILSACVTAAGRHDDDFGTVATALLRAGIPAVVANQLSIPIDSVAPFVGALYSDLLLTGNIDHAVMAGRVALAIELNGATNGAVVEWGIPTLYRMSGAAQLLP